jgi:hypothetical protein
MILSLLMILLVCLVDCGGTTLIAVVAGTIGVGN